jgi:threonine dehydratase
LLGPIAEGAGTIAAELGRMHDPLDACIVPLGNGSLINGMGLWLKRFSPSTRVIAVCPNGATAMFMSWRAGKPVSTEAIDTIADGIAVRVPVPEALEIMHSAVDDVMLVSDPEIVEAMQWLHGEEDILGESTGAPASLPSRSCEMASQARVAVPLTAGT